MIKEWSEKEYSDFMKRVVVTETCWLWKGWKKYGRCVFYGDEENKTKQVSAQRRSMELHNKLIPKGFKVRPKCGHRRCVRLDHMEFVKFKESSRPAIAKPASHSETISPSDGQVLHSRSIVAQRPACAACAGLGKAPADEMAMRLRRLSEPSSQVEMLGRMSE